MVSADVGQHCGRLLDVVMEFGIGVGMDRTNGAAAYLVAGGTWSNPTIS